jgi:hypothetical protein
MRRLPDAAFWIASSAREVSWIAAWSAFTLSVLAQPIYPIQHALGAFVLASLAVTWNRQGRWSLAQLLALHGAGVCWAWAGSVHMVWCRNEAFWSPTWLEHAFSRARSDGSGFTLAAFFVWTLAFWASGFAHAQRSLTYRQACSRFDRGLTWLFALLFMKLLLRGQVGVPTSDGVSEALVLPFFAGGVVSIALARNRSGAQKSFLRGYRGIGLVLGFAAAIMLCSAAAALLVLPFLRTASAAGYRGLTTVGRPVADSAAQVLLFVCGLARFLPPPQIYRGGGPSTGIRHDQSAPETHVTVSEPSGSGAWLLLGLALAVAVGLGAWYLRRWHSTRARGVERKAGVFELLRRWFARWLARLGRFVAQWRERRRQHEALHLYRRLLRWGRRNGSPKRPSETPIEYGRRLQQQLDGASAEIDPLVAAFNAYVYGHASVDPQSLTRARRALRRLQSPRLWPKRLRLWLMSEGGYGMSPSHRISELTAGLVARDSQDGS